MAPVLSAENASEYGLTSRSVTLTVYTHGGESKSLQIGDPTPDLMHDYVKMDDDIFLSRTRISLSVAATETALVNTMSTLENELE